MGNPVRILHVLGWLERGGAETMIMNLYRNIDRTKIQFDFVVHTEKKCAYESEVEKLGGRIFRMPRYIGINHFAYKKEWYKFFYHNPEYKIIHGHMRSTAAIYLGIAKKSGLLTIAHSHSTASRGNKVEQLMKNILQYPIRYIADYLFSCSDPAGQWLFGSEALKKNNYKVIKNAIDIPKYKFNASKRNNIRNNLGLEGKFVLGHVGSLSSPKNHSFLINMFNEILKKNDNVMLLLVGDGELRIQVENQIKSLGISDRVILTGAVSNVSDFLQAMDVFVFPSKFEGLGIAVIEAQVAGLRCFVSDAVPEEAFISDLIEKLPLKNNLSGWCNKILHSSSQLPENRSLNKMDFSDYSIEENAVLLETLYLKMLGENVDV